MTATTDAAAQAAPAASISKGYRSYALGALLIVYTFNFIDRTLVGVLNEPIKVAFNATDSMMGLLGGPAFAVLYTFLGMPIGRLAERFNRVAIVAAALAIWSIMTVLCGMAGQLNPNLHIGIYLAILTPVALIFILHRMWVSTALVLLAVGGSAFMPAYFASIGFAGFGILLMTRIGVGIGEAGCSPPSHSLISDYFPPDRRASALSIYALGIPLGSMLSAVGGGWLAQNVDWRAAFLWLGLPGVILALIVLFTVREPPRSGAHEEAPDFGAALKTLMSKATFWHIALGGAITSFVGYGVGQFLNSFFMRTHGLSPLEASLYFGIVGGLAAAVGTFVGGNLADRLSKWRPTSYSLVPGIGLIVATPLYVGGLLSPSLPVLLAALIPAAILHYTYLGPMFGVTQGLVEPRMRATASALLLFIVNLLGYGLGPPLVGFLSDFLAASNFAAAGGGDYAHACADLATGGPACAAARADGLKLAMIIGVCGYAWGGLHFLLAGRTMQRDTVS